MAEEDVPSVMRQLHLGSGLAFRSLPSAATVEEVLGVEGIERIERVEGPCAATRPPKTTLKKLITKPTERLNGKAPMAPMPSARAAPSGMESDDESDDDVLCQDATAVFSKDAFLDPDLPELSEDEGETAKPLPPVAATRQPKPLPVKVAKEPLTAEEKAAIRLNKDEAEREQQRLAAVEKRRAERDEQASLRAQALSVLEGGPVKLGKTFAQITSHALMCHRARAVPGVADILAKRQLLDDPEWLPPTFVRTPEGATICKTGVRALYQYEERQSFLDAAKKLKTKRLEEAHARLGSFVSLV